MKRILMYLYILLIAGLTFILVPVFSVMGSTNFLENYRELFESSDLDLMSGTTLAFRNDGTSLIINKEPIFSETYTRKDENGNLLYNFNLDFYSVVEKKGKKYNSGFYVLIKDIYLKDKNIILDDEGRYLIRLELYFDQPIIYEDKKVSKSEDVFIPLYDGKSGVLFFDQSFLKNDQGLVEIEKILITVKTEQKYYIDLLNLYNDNYTGEIKEDKFDNNVNRNISNITSSNIDLLSKIDTNNISSDDSLYYNNNLRKTFRSKYNYFPYFLFLWILVVSVITYFLFVHKYVKLRMQEKKEIKQKEFEKLKEKIKMEENK